jgi:hypothetical protein
MEKERFYTGDVREGSIPAFLEKAGPLTMGLARGEETMTLIDTIALNCYTELKNIHRFEEVVHRVKETISELKESGKLKNMRLEEVGETLTQSVKTTVVDTSKIKIDEGELIGKLIENINEITLHELSLHVFARLRHYPTVYDIEFKGRGLDLKEATELVKRFGLKAAFSFSTSSATEVTDMQLEKEEKLDETVEGLQTELESKGLETKVWYAKKEYPVQFGLRDIKILKDKIKPTMFYLVKRK